METVSEITVFVASPSDCVEERLRVWASAETVNHALGTQLGVRLRVTGWEQQQGDFGRPQAQINTLVDDCDIFVGLMKRRWGSPTGTHTSGFLEEFERASARRASGPTPSVALWFQSLPSELTADPGDQLRQVMDFQNQVRTQRLALHGVFDGPDDFETKIVTYFMVAIASAARADDQMSLGGTSTSTAVSEQLRDDLDGAKRQIASVGSAIASAVEGSVEDRIDSDRMLLLALALQPEDEHALLPVHAANRLFRRRTELALSVIEHRLWLRTVLSDLAARPSGEVVPGWSLLSPDGADKSSLAGLVELAESSSLPVAGGALRALHRLSARPVEFWPVGDDQTAAVERWRSALRDAGPAAIAYAVEVATSDDVGLIEAVSHATLHEEFGALRDVLSGNVEGLVDLVSDKYSTPSWMIGALAEVVANLPPDQLRKLVRGRTTPESVRAGAFKVLGNVGRADIEAMIAAGMADLVFDGLDAGRLSQANVEAAIATIVNDVDRRELQARFRRFAEPMETLLAELRDPGQMSQAAWDALSWSRDPMVLDTAREVFDTNAEMIVAPYLSTRAWQDSEDLVEFVRARARFGALRILMSQEEREPSDVERILSEVARSGEEVTDEMLRLLAEAADEPHIDSLLDQREHALVETRRLLTARALDLGGPSVARRLLAETNVHDRRAAAGLLAESLSAADLQELRDLLHDWDDEVRMIAAESLTRRLRLDEISDLLVAYPAEHDVYYYNVVVVFDWHLFSSQTQ